MGCAAFTPSLVGLASELEGKNFHLVASYNQRGSQEKALHEIFQNGLSVAPPNVSATMSARHPKVQGIKYVPYYIVFDHHGDLVYHHQGGPYHGGDGKDVLARVRTMLKEVPAIYVGKEPFETHKRLADEISRGKKLGASLKKLAKALEAAPDDPELARLVAAIERHARNERASIESDLATNPKGAFKALDLLEKAYAETAWGSDIKELAAQYEAKSVRKASEVAAKELNSIVAGWQKLPAVRGNGGQVRNPLDERFRTQNAAHLDELKKALGSLTEDAKYLPAGARAAALLGLLSK